MALGYLVLTLCYYKGVFGGRDLKWMSTSLFFENGTTYDQTLILNADNSLNKTKLAEVGLPYYTTTYAVSQMCYNFSLGAAVVHVMLWYWADLKRGEIPHLVRTLRILIPCVQRHDMRLPHCVASASRSRSTTLTTGRCRSTRKCQYGGT